MSDLISRQEAIDAFDCTNELIVGGEANARNVANYINKVVGKIKDLPSVEPERLTDDDFEAIRIHLNAYKENLCNQRRWKEAEEYQRIIDRFMAFTFAQPEIIRCKECRHMVINENHEEKPMVCCKIRMCGTVTADDFCSWAERRTDGQQLVRKGNIMFRNTIEAGRWMAYIGALEQDASPMTAVRKIMEGR